MNLNFFKLASKNSLGVDIGTFSIKIVELAQWGKRKKLENYGEMQATALYQKPFRTFEKSTLTVADKDVVRAISGILQEAKIKTKKAYFSIPDFSSFFTTFTLPAMTREELPQAVRYEARQHIPLPLSEVTLDWQIIGEGKILLVAVPNEVIRQYQEIAQSAGLELLALEAEVFSLSRGLIDEATKKETAALVDIGARSTTISIIERGILKISHSFDASGSDLTNMVAQSLSIGYEEAEDLKKKQGLSGPEGPTEADIQKSILPFIDLILVEIEKILQNFYKTENKTIQRVILAGGSAFLPGLADYFSKNLEKPVEIAKPFADIFYPPILEKTLKGMGPSFAIAVGSALKGLE